MEPDKIDRVMRQAATAYSAYKKMPASNRATFLEAIAAGLELAGDSLMQIASLESNLPIARLTGELGRTCHQLRMYARLISEGHWVEAIIDHGNTSNNPPAPDLRRIRIPLGPVVVFGASNFPLAYSTAGGDSASALAAGCPVVVKQHPAHSDTSLLVYKIMLQAAKSTGMPEHVVQHVGDSGFATGKALVQHPATAAVGFTGSYAGGMALQAYAAERKHPIPVFAEMGSTNPVFLLPGALQEDTPGIAEKYAKSITLGMGQFCTNPGLIFGISSDVFNTFKEVLQKAIQATDSALMLHAGIEQAYIAKTRDALAQKGVNLLTTSGYAKNDGLPQACLAEVSAGDFLSNPLMHEEIFGPWSLVVQCSDADEMLACRNAVAGQLTTSIMGNKDDLEKYEKLTDAALEHSGRVVFNGVPTGVEVAAAMVHGGPHPASSDSRFTAVGPMAIQRWTRPVCWQNSPEQVLPDALKDENPLGIWRMVDGEFGV